MLSKFIKNTNVLSNSWNILSVSNIADKRKNVSTPMYPDKISMAEYFLIQTANSKALITGSIQNVIYV